MRFHEGGKTPDVLMSQDHLWHVLLNSHARVTPWCDFLQVLNVVNPDTKHPQATMEKPGMDLVRIPRSVHNRALAKRKQVS